MFPLIKHLRLSIAFSYQKIYDEIDSLNQIFKNNGYPIPFMHRYAKQFLQKFYVTEATEDTAYKSSYLQFYRFDILNLL